MIDSIECIGSCEIACEECGGTGNDPGGLSAWEKTDCPACGGSGRVLLVSSDDANDDLRGADTGDTFLVHAIAASDDLETGSAAAAPIPDLNPEPKPVRSSTQLEKHQKEKAA